MPTQHIVATVARGSAAATEQQNNNGADVKISTSGDWAQDESLVGLLAQNPFFNDDSVRVFIPFLDRILLGNNLFLYRNQTMNSLPH
jgi:hypothetical protein